MKKATINSLKVLAYAVLTLVVISLVGLGSVYLGYGNLFTILFTVMLVVAAMSVTGVLPYLINRIRKW